MRAGGILAVADKPRRNGTVFTAEVLREFARRDRRLEFDEGSGELSFDGEFYGDDLSRLREALEQSERGNNKV